MVTLIFLKFLLCKMNMMKAANCYLFIIELLSMRALPSGKHLQAHAELRVIGDVGVELVTCKVAIQHLNYSAN